MFWWPRESVEDSSDELDGDQTLDCPPRVRDGPRFHTGLRYEWIQKELIKMDFLRYRHVFMLVLLAMLVGCYSQQGSQDLKGANRASNSGREARCQGCGGGDQRTLEPR